MLNIILFINDVELDWIVVYYFDEIFLLVGNDGGVVIGGLYVYGFDIKMLLLEVKFLVIGWIKVVIIVYDVGGKDFVIIIVVLDFII